MSVKLYQGDSYGVLRRLIDGGVRVASCVSDPPYGLTSIIDRFGKEGSKAAKFGTDGAFARASKGFMNKTWDGTGVERDPAFWRLVYDVLLPGGFVVAFSSARTYHLMATAIEQAGFVTHPMIGWCYATGMPKPHNPKVVGLEGWRTGGQVRKPALEPIYVGQKPFSEKTGRLNILKHGVGAVNVEECRVPRTDNLNGGAYSKNGSRKSLNGDPLGKSGMFTAGRTTGKEFEQPEGGWPANLITDGSDAVRSVIDPKFFESYGYICERCQDQGWVAGGDPMEGFWQEGCPECEGRAGLTPFDGAPLVFHRKANADDRAGSNHATVKPIGLMRSLVRHVTPPGMSVLDPFAGTGTTGIAAELEGREAILIEAEPEYAQDIRRRLSKLTDAGETYLKAIGVI